MHTKSGITFSISRSTQTDGSQLELEMLPPVFIPYELCASMACCYYAQSSSVSVASDGTADLNKS